MPPEPPLPAVAADVEAQAAEPVAAELLELVELAQLRSRQFPVEVQPLLLELPLARLRLAEGVLLAAEAAALDVAVLVVALRPLQQ
jgi:hypothetical protein